MSNAVKCLKLPVQRKDATNLANFYYYNKNLDSKGNHEVHTSECSYLPAALNRVMIGYENDCNAAIQRVKKETGKTNYDGCYHCSYPCHKG